MFSTDTAICKAMEDEIPLVCGGVHSGSNSQCDRQCADRGNHKDCSLQCSNKLSERCYVAAQSAHWN